MKVLVACEFSGRVRDAFKLLGHDAWSCDLLPTEIEGQHIEGNVLEILDNGWDLLIAHPPCTYLANSGVRWLYRDDKTINQDRWDSMLESVKFFNVLLEAPVYRIAVENPIMHKHARELLAKTYNQIIQPWQFGEGETKATCLWLNNLPLLTPTNIVDGRIQRVFNEPPSENRWKNRSRTYMGIAEAMANQWSKL